MCIRKTNCQLIVKIERRHSMTSVDKIVDTFQLLFTHHSVQGFEIIKTGDFANKFYDFESKVMMKISLLF